MSGELHGNPQIAKRVLLISLQLICQNFSPFFRAPMGFIGNNPVRARPYYENFSSFAAKFSTSLSELTASFQIL